MPLHSIQPLSDCAALGLWHLTEEPSALLPLLPYAAEYETRQPPITHAQRRAEWLAGRVLAHTMLQTLPDATDGPIGNDANGRPYFLHQAELALSLSHSGAWVAAVVSTRGRVGTDVECIREKAQKLAPRFLAESERADAGDDAAKFSLYWSAKETLYKLHSRRGLVFREQLLLDPFRLRKAGVLTGHLLVENFRSQHQIHYQRLSSDYVLTYCLETAPVLLPS